MTETKTKKPTKTELFILETVKALVPELEQHLDNTLKEFVPHFVQVEIQKFRSGDKISQVELTIQGHLYERLKYPSSKMDIIDALYTLLRKAEAGELHPNNREAFADHIVDILEADRKHKLELGFRIAQFFKFQILKFKLGLGL